MLRGYRGIVIALAGLILLGASPSTNLKNKDETGQGPAKIEHPVDAISASSEKIAKASETGEYQKPCQDGEANNNSDLCAQWYTARAARDAADWAFWALIVGIVGAVGIVAALWLTVDSNRIARDTAKRQLRPYVHPEIVVSAQNLDPQNHNFWWNFYVVWKNTGSTPAVESSMVIWPEIVDEALADNFKFDRVAKDHVPLLFGPNSTLKSADIRISAPDIRQISRGEKTLYLWGWVKYKSVFPDDPERETRFCYRMFVTGDPTREVGPENIVQWPTFIHTAHNSAT
jgi:hypothetical protein